MLAELPEDDAAGEIAGIYGEIRRLWAVPYVSSLQRHLASRPGWLEWSWRALAPAFVSGAAQTSGWGVAEHLTLPPTGLIAPTELCLTSSDWQSIQDICFSFVRVAPVNLMFAGLLRCLLKGRNPVGPGWQGDNWVPPKPMPPLPQMVNMGTQSVEQRAALAKLGTDVDGEQLVPGLYRILAQWPAVLAYLGDALPPLASAPETIAARAELLRGIDAAVEEIFAQLPPLKTGAAPPRDGRDGVLAALDAYRLTSPEMVIFGRIIICLGARD